jgi:hypothetical protein
MGAKYLPTIKDQKAGQRFQRKQLGHGKLTKPTAIPPAGNPPAKKRQK